MDQPGRLSCNASQHEQGCVPGFLTPQSSQTTRVSEEIRFREEATSNTEGGKLLVKELNQLSIEERQRALEDVHGVRSAVEESQDLIEQSLGQLEEALSKIRTDRTAYDRAIFMSPSYAKRRSFQIMFLRAEFFNARKAAKRMMNYFHHKERLFGLNKLVKDIELEDLGEDDLQDMMSGYLQVLPNKDRSGRAVVVSFHEKHNYRRHENHHRMTWYTIMSLMEDPDVQRLGLAVVLYNVGYDSLRKENIEFLLNSTFLTECLPMKFASCHFCYNDMKLLPLMSAFQMTIGKEARVRFRAHYGSHQEVLYSLLSFGIQRRQMPLDETYAIMNTAALDFMQKRTVIEMKKKSENMSRRNVHNDIEYPRSLDVLLGRGRPFHGFPGNVQLAELIEQRKEEYRRLDRLNKTALTHDLVRMVRNSGGRFLKRADNGSGKWKEVSDEVAREKVSHGFRTKTRRSHQQEREINKRPRFEYQI